MVVSVYLQWEVVDMLVRSLASVVFFFQAEDGIRDIGVTGVQTCALPISSVGIVRHALETRRSFSFPGGKSGLVASILERAPRSVCPLPAAATRVTPRFQA